MKKVLFILIFLTCSALLGSQHRNSESGTLDDKSWSFTFSPVHLISEYRMIEVSVEKIFNERYSVAFIGGAGRLTLDTGEDQLVFPIYELGAQFRYYFNHRSKHKLNIGVEALWLHIDLSDLHDGDNVSLKSTGLGIAPFVGYKYVADIGFTFDFQLGGGTLLVETKDNVEGVKRTDKSYTLLNLNFGWSF